MSVNNEVDVRAMKIALSVNTLFAGGFDVTVIGKIFHPNENDIVGSKTFVSLTAGSDNELIIVDTAAYVTPCTGNKACGNKLFTCFNNYFFCF